MIDNYDSFVHNLARYIRQLGFATQMVRNDELTIEEILALNPEKIIISPGPGNPDQAGICLQLVQKLGPCIPILGVCLGHQVIAQAFGGHINRALKPVHGKSSFIYHHNNHLFYALPSPMKVGRYHSLIVNKQLLPKDLEILAETVEGEIMAIRHKVFPIYGVQFHPESIITEGGLQLLSNFLYHTTNAEHSVELVSER